MWSSKEYQIRFEESGGAYIFLPRCSTKSIVLANDEEEKSNGFLWGIIDAIMRIFQL